VAQLLEEEQELLGFPSVGVPVELVGVLAEVEALAF